MHRGFALPLVVGSIFAALVLISTVFFIRQKITPKASLRPAGESTSAENFVVYSPKVSGFSIQYPKTWKVESKGLDGASFTNPDNEAFFWLDTTIAADLQRDSLNQVTENFQKLLQTSSPASDTIIDGKQAKKFSFDYKGQKSGKGESIIVCCVSANPASGPGGRQDFYTILAVTYPNGEKDNKQIFSEMINSIKILPLDWQNLHK